jgi:hypothetical protein
MSGDPQTFLDGAVSAIRRYCGWHVAPRVTEEIVLDGIGGVDLYLPTLRLTDIVSIKSDGQDIPVTNVDFSRDGIIELHSGSWSRRLGGIRLTIEHGFEDAHELTTLATNIAARAASSPRGVTAESSDGVSVQFSRFGGSASGGVALFEHEYKLLDLYKVGRY